MQTVRISKNLSHLADVIVHLAAHGHVLAFTLPVAQLFAGMSRKVAGKCLVKSQ
jgi:hypothetical protein